MSSPSHSQSNHRNNHHMQVQSQTHKNKLFITNLQGHIDTKELEERLRELFKDYGNLTALTVKKSRNSQYCFAFVQYRPGQDAAEAIQKLDNTEILGKIMKVQYQDDDKRRKDANKGCYVCGKMGHFARQCKYKNDSRFQIRRSVSRQRSRSRDRKKKHKKHRYSSSDRSKTPKKKKQKKNKSRSKDQKKKKHKKKHYRSSSEE